MMHRHAGVVAAMVLASGAAAEEAVQWRVQDGGNGHWYRVRVSPTGVTWETAILEASQVGAHLATLTSAGENAFVMAMVGTSGPWFAPGVYPDALIGPWLGGSRSSLSGPWSWITQEAWSFTAFCSNQPSSVACTDPELVLHIKLGVDCSPNHGWGDVTASGECLPELAHLVAAVEEWSADCNADGLVDFGQIRAGELEDSNANNIPDCCESAGNCDPCAADVVEDGVVNGVDLAAVVNAWGTAGGKLPRTDVDGSGVVDGSDLAAVLGSWGPCQP